MIYVLLQKEAGQTQVFTDSADIKNMQNRGEITYLGIPPSHNTIVGSPHYGERIIFSEENGVQFLRLSGKKDDVWIKAQQTPKSSATGTLADVTSDALDAFSTYLIIDAVVNTVSSVGSGISEVACSVGECIGDIVSGICE